MAEKLWKAQLRWEGLSRVRSILGLECMVCVVCNSYIGGTQADVYL